MDIWDTLQVTLGPKCYNKIDINVNTLQTYTFSILKLQNQIHCISVRKVYFTHLDLCQLFTVLVIYWAMKQSINNGLRHCLIHDKYCQQLS